MLITQVLDSIFDVQELPISNLYLSPEAMQDIMNWCPPSELTAEILGKKMIDKPCPDCTDGKYYGFNTIETCKTCNGTLKIEGSSKKYIEETTEAVSQPLISYGNIVHSYGLGFEKALGLNDFKMDCVLPSGYPPSTKVLINNFRTSITSDIWKKYDGYTFGDNNEKIFVNSKGEVQLILDFGFYVCFMVNDSHLLNVFQDVESKNIYVTYDLIDKMLGAYV